MIKGTKVVLREKRIEDAVDDYTWKTDDELARLDATIPLDIPFSLFLSGYAEELRYANMRGHRFAIEALDGKHIGNCAYYNFDECKEETELGIIIGVRDYWNMGYGKDVVNILVKEIFEKTKLKRIYLHTLEWNTRAKECFQKCGFVSCGKVVRWGQTFIRMEIKNANSEVAG